MKYLKVLCLLATVSAGILLTGCNCCKTDAQADGSIPAPAYDVFSGMVEVNGEKIEMVKAVSGGILIGSPASERGRDDDEKQIYVTFKTPFWIGKYEVTQAQWRAVMGPQYIDVDALNEQLKKQGKETLPWLERTAIRFNNIAAVYTSIAPSFMLPDVLTPSEFKGDNRPVENVSWNDAKAFCKKLNALYADKLPRGYRFDLPTEKQWEYACRAGTAAALNNDSHLRDLTHYCENLAEVAWYDYNGTGSKTHNVGLKRPNAWGIYDMHGNVFEWCRDKYNDYKSTKKKPYSTADYVIRGGSWYSNAKDCRSAYRHWYLSTYRRSYVGFRVALVSE